MSEDVVTLSLATGTVSSTIVADLIPTNNGAVNALDGGSIVVWSPTGIRAVFMKDRELWIMDADGSNQKRIIPDSAFFGGISDLQWSPDEKYVSCFAYNNVNEGANVFYVPVADAGSGVTARWMYPSLSSMNNHGWTADSTGIVYTDILPSYSIKIKNVNTGVTITVTSGYLLGVSNDDRIIYCSTPNGPDWDYFTSPLIGGSATQIVPQNTLIASANHGYARFEPLGTKIVIVGTCYPSNGGQIAVVVDNGAVVSTLLDDPINLVYMGFHWVETGRIGYLDYTVTAPDLKIHEPSGSTTSIPLSHSVGAQPDWKPKPTPPTPVPIPYSPILQAVAKKGTGAVTFGLDGLIVTTLLPATFGVTNIYEPLWSPDGTKIVFTDDHYLWVCMADGSVDPSIGHYQLGSTDIGMTWGFAWSPDGTHIAVATQASILYTIAVNGVSDYVVLKNPVANICGPTVWSSDSQNVVYTTGSWPNTSIYRKNIHTNVETLVVTPGWAFDISPDDRVFFVVDGHLLGGAHTIGDLYLTPLYSPAPVLAAPLGTIKTTWWGSFDPAPGATRVLIGGGSVDNVTNVSQYRVFMLDGLGNVVNSMTPGDNEGRRWFGDLSGRTAYHKQGEPRTRYSNADNTGITTINISGLDYDEVGYRQEAGAMSGNPSWRYK